MITNTVSGKAASKPLTAADSPAQKAAASKGTRQPPTAAPPSAAARSVSSIISAAGLPADKISASIISFARFFSLPLKPELMTAIRRQTFAQPAAAQQAAAQPAAATQPAAAQPATDNAPELAAKNREALSLAAAAAESKGVELEQGGLEAFARAIDPQRRESDGRQRGRRDKNRRGEEPSQEEGGSQKTAAITASVLKETALESAQKDPLLAVLNKLPGKNGRWLVLPFDFCEDGREFKVSLRILLEPDHILNRADFMAVDVVESGRANRRLFVIEAANGKADRLACYLQSEVSPKTRASLVNELSRLLEIKPERVFVKVWEEDFPFESANRDDLLRSIDEVV